LFFKPWRQALAFLSIGGIIATHRILSFAFHRREALDAAFAAIRPFYRPLKKLPLKPNILALLDTRRAAQRCWKRANPARKMLSFVVIGAGRYALRSIASDALFCFDRML
jgi:hypothetical protein